MWILLFLFSVFHSCTLITFMLSVQRLCSALALRPRVGVNPCCLSLREKNQNLSVQTNKNSKSNQKKFYLVCFGRSAAAVRSVNNNSRNIQSEGSSFLSTLLEKLRGTIQSHLQKEMRFILKEFNFFSSSWRPVPPGSAAQVQVFSPSLCSSYPCTETLSQSPPELLTGELCPAHHRSPYAAEPGPPLRPRWCCASAPRWPTKVRHVSARI